MKISDKKLLRLINLENKKINLSKKYILSNKVTIIKNSLKDNIFEDFIKLSKSFGTYLHYDNKPYYKFDETSQQEIGFHTDGVSCLDYKKIPKYLFFYVKDWPQNKKGFFKISSIKKIISKIPENYLSILKKNKLQYLNYSGTLQKFNKSKNFKDVVSFEKYCLRKINGNWTLDMFLPLRKMHKDLKWEYKMKFQK